MREEAEFSPHEKIGRLMQEFLPMRGNVPPFQPGIYVSLFISSDRTWQSGYQFAPASYNLSHLCLPVADNSEMKQNVTPLLFKAICRYFNLLQSTVKYEIYYLKLFR